jgi:hypothetical protein
MVINVEAEWGEKFSDGIAAIKIENGKWGYIKKYGNLLLKPLYYHTFTFENGLGAVAGFEKKDKSYMSGYIDKNGKWVWKGTSRQPGY